ncbi:TM2 domain-containing protein [Terrisporobacter glycolicus]|uniref:TM2 domain-containing protein n=1 Tax=Terrisporobacter glycolicus TaxID=36841 RepID=UPI003463D90B
MEEKTILQKIFWRNSNTEYKFDFILCLTLGWLGVHRFKNKKWGTGILYLLTRGVFYIGWGLDTIKLLYLAFILDDEGLEQYEITQEEKLKVKEEKELRANRANDEYWHEKFVEKNAADSRKREAKASGQACCPKCGSTSLTANKKGFGLIKGAAGVMVAGPVGVVAAGHGKNKVIVTCLNCGKQFKPGKNY